mgnify:CR=1 FL=1
MAIIVANDGSRFVDTLAERNSIPVERRFNGMRVTVKDATADPLFGGGSVQYLWDRVAQLWVPIWSDKKPDLTFATEEKTIVDGAVTTDNIVKDGIIWSARVVDLSGVILGDAQVTVAGNVITLNTQDHNGMVLHYTYAYGSMTTQLMEIWSTKANVDSPAFTGNPTAPTPANASDDDSVATTAYVQAVLAENPSGISDAPADGLDYVRKDNAWSELDIAFDAYSIKSTVSATGPLVVNADSQQAFVVTNKSAGTRTLSFNNGPAGRMATAVLIIDGSTGDLSFTGTNLKWNESKIITRTELGPSRTILLFLWDGIDTWVGNKGSAY